MGNSGSNDLQQHGHLPREYLKHYRDVGGGGGSGGNHQNFRRQASHQQLPVPVKVLPDPGGARLRPTNNGNILQSGGTLTGKKLYRSQSISATHQNPSPGKSSQVNPPYLMQRSQTLLHFGERRPAQDITNFHSSRYGSQPELRADEVDHSSGGGGPVSLTTASNKYSKMKKMKKPAPQAPQKEFEPSRLGWKQQPSHHQSFGPSKQEQAMNSLPPVGPQGRKMRLFKTKAESKKTSPTNRQSMDGHHHQDTSYLPEPKRSPQHHRHEEQFQSLPFQRSHAKPSQTATQERKPSFPKVSLFRREKSFDITLMQNQNRPKELPAARTSVRRHSPEPTKKPMTTLIKSQPSKLREPEKTVAKSTFRKPLPATASAVKHKQTSPKPAQLPTTDFQKELLLATRRRSTLTLERLEKAETRKEEPKPKTELAVAQAKITEVIIKKEEKTVISVEKSSTVSKEASPKPQESRKVSTVSGGETKPQKSFYFGMDTTAESKVQPEQPMNKEQLDLIDRFAESIMNKNKFAVTSQESAISSETASLHSFLDTEADKHEIALNLRPTLPRKQFEIPRFSPVAAWRLLTAEDESKENTTEWYSNVDKAVSLNLQLSVEHGDHEHDEHDEERIERIYREPIPGLQDNKSGDSGISGEMADEPSQQIAEENPLNNSYMSAWTPQQDLGDDDFEERAGDSPPINDFSIKGHIFSLTLPREHHLGDKTELQAFNSLQKIKRTSHNDSETSDHVPSSRNDNWFLSRSGQNSLEISGGSGGTLMRDHTGKGGHDKKNDALGSLTSGKHVMYLPNRDQTARMVTLEYSGESRDSPRRDYVDDEEVDEEDLPDDGDNDKTAYLPDVIKTNVRKISKSRNYHRFTFQSTIRQVERRQIADKLSREAEEKEAQRLSELEAMQRVEEEFQKKRAREKASIRHQLRIYSLEEGHQSMPDWEINNERVEPEGAVSSPSPSPRPSSPAPAFTNMFKRPSPVANDDQISDDYRDSKTPYIKRIIEEKSSKHFQRKAGDKPVENTSSKTRKTNEVHITNGTHSDKIIQIMGWSDRHQAKRFK